MDLTNQYISYKLGGISRAEIIIMIDAMINELHTVDELLIDLSLSSMVDDYEFEKRLLPYVDIDKITVKSVIPILKQVVIGKNAFTAVELLSKLNWFVYDLGFHKKPNPISEFYYYLDHLYTDAIPGEYADSNDVQSYLQEWLTKTDG